MSDPLRAAQRPTPRIVMLMALTSCFALSQAYRTVAALMAPQLQAEFAATNGQYSASAIDWFTACGSASAAKTIARPMSPFTKALAESIRL